MTPTLHKSQVHCSGFMQWWACNSLTSAPSPRQLSFWTSFWKFSERTLFKTFAINFWLFLMSKFRILRSRKHHLLRLYRVSPLWRQGFNRDSQTDMHIKPRKSALRKLRDWEKARIVTVYHACQMHLYCASLELNFWLNRPLYFLNLNALTRFLRLQTTEW